MAGERVLVTAGAGHQGKSLIPKLAQAGFRVRAVRRSEGKGDELKALGAHEVFIGDLGDEATSFEALKAVDAVYHIGPGGPGNGVHMGLAMLRGENPDRRRHGVL